MDYQKTIVAAIEAHISNTGDSQNALATKIDISAATLTAIKKGNWQNISPAMWNKVASFFNLREDWQLFATPNFNRVTKLCDDAQQQHKMLAVAAFTGSGKTTALREYARKTPNAYYFLCTAVMGRKEFVRGVLRSMGLEDAGNIAACIQTICERLNEASSPLLILDDAGKLGDSILPVIQIIYDATEFRAGIVLAGTEYMKTYIDKMAGKDKKGFRELKRRIQFWQSLVRPSKAVISQFAQQHGVMEETAITYIVRTVTDYGTLRNLLSNARQAVAQKPNMVVSAELLAGLHIGDHNYQGN